MTNRQYYTAVSEAADYTDRDAYISDLALSSMWEDAEDAPIPEDRIADLGAIWDAAHRTVKEISAAAGMSVRQLALHFSVPQRTVEQWASAERTPPPYVLLMMQEALGLILIDRA